MGYVNASPHSLSGNTVPYIRIVAMGFPAVKALDCLIESVVERVIGASENVLPKTRETLVTKTSLEESMEAVRQGT